MSHAVVEKRKALNPDAKRPSERDVTSALGQPFRQWARNPTQVAHRGEVLSLLSTFVRPLQEETAALHRAIFRLEQRTLRGRLRQLWRWLNKPINEAPPVPEREP